MNGGLRYMGMKTGSARNEPAGRTAEGGVTYGYFNAEDGISIRYGTLNAKNAVGAVVLLGGRKEFIEKYRETITELIARGFDVYTFDWRGQGLSTRLLENRHKGHVGSFDHYVKDLSQFMEKIVPAQKGRKLIFLAHSMGGHIALRYLHENPGRVTGAVLTAPMIDIDTAPLPKKVARWVTAAAMLAGRGEGYAIGSKDYDPQAMRFPKNPLTGDPVRFAVEKSQIRQNPDLALGGVTYGWLWESFRSIDRMKGRRFASEISTPVLVINAGRDTIVDGRAQQRICRRMPGGRFVCIEGARHEILKEIDEIRNAFWDAFDSFAADL